MDGTGQDSTKTVVFCSSDVSYDVRHPERIPALRLRNQTLVALKAGAINLAPKAPQLPIRFFLSFFKYANQGQ